MFWSCCSLYVYYVYYGVHKTSLGVPKCSIQDRVVMYKYMVPMIALRVNELVELKSKLLYFVYQVECSTSIGNLDIYCKVF